MELLQDGYLAAIVAAAGCTMAKPVPDDGIDWIVTHSINGATPSHDSTNESTNARIATIACDSLGIESGDDDEEDADLDDDDDVDEVDLKIQLKSTAKCAPNPQSGFVSVSLSNRRFRELARKRPSIPRILVAMILPKNIDKWISASHYDIKIQHCAYWVNMQGLAPTSGQKTSSVSVPTTQIFDDVALCEMMQRIRQGGAP